MRRLHSGGALLCLFLLWNSLSAAAEPATDLDELLRQLHAELETPALSAAVVLNGELVYSGGAGLANLEHAAPATGQTVYRIASISKPIAAVAVMQLVQRGLVSLDDPIHQYVPEFPEKDQGTVTLEHLLTHSSGIRHYRGREFFEARRFTDLASAIEVFKDDPLEFTPGEKFQYSSYAFNLLAGVVESVTGQSFEAYLSEQLWQPAEMQHTYFDRCETIIPQRAGCYVRGQDPGTFVNAPYVDLSIKWAGGGMLSTAEDLARFHMALSAEKILSADAQAEMYTPRVQTGPGRHVGLSWFIESDDKDLRWVMHSGGGVGATTHLLRCPETNDAVVLLSNISGGKSLASSARKFLQAVRTARDQSQPATAE